jgi:DNA-binding beta-propeller fold protein YncE
MSTVATVYVARWREAYNLRSNMPPVVRAALSLAFACLVLGVVAHGTQRSTEPLTLDAVIDLPNVEGRIDHLAADPSGQRLFLAALGNDTVEVLDIKNNRHLKSLRGFHEPQGIAYVPDANLFVVANGEGDGVQFVDGREYSMGKSVALGSDSDNVRYDAAAKRIYVGFGGGAIAAVDPQAARSFGQVKLPAHPESFQLEKSGSRIFVNVPNAGHIDVIDRTTMKIVATWPVTGARANFPMALDEAGHRLFVGCRRPAKVLVFDTGSGRELASADIVGDTDDLFFDAARKRLYVTGGEGDLDVLAAEGGSLTRVARIQTASGARTSLFVPELNRLYIAVPHRGAQRAQVRVYVIR